MKILIPMIRNILPTLVAQDIVGVQPLVGSQLETGETYVDEAASHATEANEVEWHWVRLPLAPGAIFNVDVQQKYIQEVIQWCSDTFGDPKTFTDSIIWMHLNGRFCFKYSKDRTAFVLKWG